VTKQYIGDGVVDTRTAAGKALASTERCNGGNKPTGSETIGSEPTATAVA
jgi:hypothetical protein